MAISIAARKAKGRKFQQTIAKKIGELLGITPEKDGDIESRPMAQAGTDIILRGKALELFPFSTECKFQETWALPSWIQQAKENQKEDIPWILFIKKSRHEPIVVLDAEHFFNLYKEVLTKRELEEEGIC